jgi:hypothetical protein
MGAGASEVLIIFFMSMRSVLMDEMAFSAYLAAG